MNTSHTPGPWIVDDWLVRPQDMRDQLDNDSEWVAVGIGDEDGYAESVAYCHLANARLIAAAPQLLEQCILLCDAIESFSAGDRWPELDKARAAINLATGQIP